MLWTAGGGGEGRGVIWEDFEFTPVAGVLTLVSTGLKKGAMSRANLGKALPARGRASIRTLPLVGPHRCPGASAQ